MFSRPVCVILEGFREARCDSCGHSGIGRRASCCLKLLHILFNQFSLLIPVKLQMVTYDDRPSEVMTWVRGTPLLFGPVVDPALAMNCHPVSSGQTQRQ